MYVVVGIGGSRLYHHADGGVRELIILNLPEGGAAASLVSTCLALTTLLSYPLVLMPAVEILLPLWRAEIAPRSRRDRAEVAPRSR